jgi:hypothetical protein
MRVSYLDANVKPDQDAQGVEGLDPEHLQKLWECGLKNPTIKLCGFHTEHSTPQLRDVLGNRHVAAPALMIPFFDRHGKRCDYTVARFMPPHVRQDGEPAKYMTPEGLPNRAYFPPFECLHRELAKPRGVVMLTEGVFKAVAACQAGVPCIGIMGMWNWQKKRPKDKRGRPYGPRLPIDDLDFDWYDMRLLIASDADQERKGNVNHGAAECCRVLSERGARCRLTRPPLGPRGSDGRPQKLGIDDFIVLYGPEAFRAWVRDAYATAPEMSLDESRSLTPERLMEDWPDGIGWLSGERPDKFNNGPPGAGKTNAGIAVRRQLGELSMAPAHGLAGIMQRPVPARSITYVPTHVQAEAVVAEAAEQGLHVVPYPRLTPDACVRHDEAEAVMNRGLAFQLTLCPTCEFRVGCPYREQRKAASEAEHAVATQARGVHTLHSEGRGENGGRRLIILDEAPLDVLRPSIVVREGLTMVGVIARVAANNALSANDKAFYKRMTRIADELQEVLKSAERSADVTPAPDDTLLLPDDLHRDLNEAILEIGSGLAPPADAMRLALAAAAGDLSLVGVGVGVKHVEGGDVETVRSLSGVFKAEPPKSAAFWINDATADHGEMETALGRPLRDITPCVRLPLRKPVLQIPRDVTKGCETETVVPILRGLLHDLHSYHRVGLLTHQKHAEGLPKLLSEAERERLVKVHYYHGGESRGSNEWHEACDVLIVLGTPRVKPSDIRHHLFRLGNVKAATRSIEEAKWDHDYWSGITCGRRRRTVHCKHYADHDWHAAHCSLVRSELVQAIGRGRGILREGIPVYVVSNENLAPPEDDDGRNGHPLADEGTYTPLTDAEAAVVEVMKKADGAIVTTAAIAKALGIHHQVALRRLKVLETARRVKRNGQRGGWWLGRGPAESDDWSERRPGRF